MVNIGQGYKEYQSLWFRQSLHSLLVYNLIFCISMASTKHELDYKEYSWIQSECNTHRLATRIFKGLDKGQFAAECECCERRVGVKEETGQCCCYDNIKLAYIGPGIPLLFTFIKNSIILLVALGLIFVAFSVYSNIKGTSCSTQGSCSDNIFDTLSIINKINQNAYLSIQNYILLAFVLVSIILLQYFRYSFRKTEDQCDDLITSPSDYALILRRLPQGTQQADIQRMVEDRRRMLTPEQRQKTENLRVVSIVMSFSMGDYTRTKIENKQQFKKLLDEQKHQEFKPKPLPPLDKTASIAIIVFGRQESKQLFRYKPNIFQNILQCIWTPCIPLSGFQVRGEYIAVERAPEPDDIVWENSKISLKGAICRKTVYSFFSILLLLVGGGIQYGLAVTQVKASQDSKTQLMMSTASSIAISIINAVIQIFLVFTSQKERNQTLTEFNTVLMVKISFFQFLNTGVFVVAANFLADPNNFSLSKGFVFEVTQVMIINAILPNLTLFILTYCQIIPKLKRCLIERGTLKNSQLQANQVYQGPNIELPYKYAYVFKTLWLTAFYAPLSPIVVPISMFGLILNYGIEKCLFGRIYSIPNMTSSMVNNSAVQLMQYFTLILSLGQYIVYLYFYSFMPEKLPLNWSIPIYISIAISAINLLLPMDSLNERLFTMPSDNFVYPSYEKVEERFQVTYEMTNPGYACTRKRKRDLLLVGSLFGGSVEMTGLFGGMAGGNQKGALLNQQDQIYQNGDNSANPLGALFAGAPANPSPSNGKAINFPMASPKQPGGVPPSFPFPLTGPSLQHKNSDTPLNTSIINQNEQTVQRKQLVPQQPANENKAPTFNGNNNSMLESLTGGFPSMNSGYPFNNHQHSGFTNNGLSGSIVSQPPFFNQAPPPGFNAIPNNGYYNPGPNNLMPFAPPINLAPQSDRSFSSTKQVRKAVKMGNQ